MPERPERWPPAFLPPPPPVDIAATCAAAGIFLEPDLAGKLADYDALLLKWQKAINLVGPTTLETRDTRHFLDSLQLLKFIRETPTVLVDIGSGAGFPGLVLALAGAGEVHLVESDIRKATFLREVSRETSAPVVIHDRRVEDCAIPGMKVLTARALAPLTDLLGHMYRLSGGETSHVTGLFPKGEQAEAEVAKAEKKWLFDLETFPSLTDPDGRILRISNLHPKTRAG